MQQRFSIRKRRQCSLAFVISVCLLLSPNASAQIFHYDDIPGIPQGVEWPRELNAFCTSVTTQGVVEPIYVDGYLDGVTGACRSKCFDGLLSGQFKFVEIIIIKKTNAPEVTWYSISPENGKYRFERMPAGHESCELFSEMLDAQARMGVGSVPGSEFYSLKANYCVGVTAVDSFESEFGIRRVIPPTASVPRDKRRVARRGEEIFNLKTEEIYAAKYDVTFEFSDEDLMGRVSCAPDKKGLRNFGLSKLIRPR
jgi:hypothetical protein